MTKAYPLPGTGAFFAFGDEEGTPADPLTMNFTLPQGEDESSLSVNFADYRAIPIWGTGKYWLCQGGGTPENPFVPVIWIDNLPINDQSPEIQYTQGDGSGDVTFYRQTGQYIAVLQGSDQQVNATLPSGGATRRLATLVVDGYLDGEPVSISAISITNNDLSITVSGGDNYSEVPLYWHPVAGWQPPGVCPSSLATSTLLLEGDLAVNGTTQSQALEVGNTANVFVDKFTVNGSGFITKVGGSSVTGFTGAVLGRNATDGIVV